MKIFILLVSQFILSDRVKTTPGAYCSDDWYHGYQDLGITYTAYDTMSGDPDAGAFVLGGSVPFGCANLQAGTFPDPTIKGCAIIEYFDTGADKTPLMTLFIDQFEYEVPGFTPKVYLGVTGVTALSLTFNGPHKYAAGVLQLCSGATCSSDPNKYTPNGFELALLYIDFDTVNKVANFKTFYLENHFTDRNFGITRRSIDFQNLQVSFLMTYQHKTSLDSYIATFDPTNFFNLESLTKFPQILGITWSAVSNNWIQGYVTSGMIFSGLFVGFDSVNQKVIYMVSYDSELSSEQVSQPKCMYGFSVTDLAFQTVFGTNSPDFRAVAVGGVPLISSTANSATVIVLQNQPASSLAFLITTKDICPAALGEPFHLAYFNNANKDLKLELLDWRLRERWLEHYMDVLMVDQSQVTPIYYYATVETLAQGASYGTFFTLQKLKKFTTPSGLSWNPAFTLTNQKYFLAQGQYQDPSYGQDIYIVGTTNQYSLNSRYQDGYLVRERSHACLSYELVSNLNVQAYVHGTITHSDKQLTSVGAIDVSSSSNNKNSLIINPTSWAYRLKNVVINPCLIRQKVLFTIYKKTTTINSTPIDDQLVIRNQNDCPFYSSNAFEYEWVVQSTTPTTTVPLLIQHPTNLLDQFQIPTITDSSACGNHQVTVAMRVLGELAWVSITTIEVEVDCCTPTKVDSWKPAQLSCFKVDIGQTAAEDLQAQFMNGNCIYSSELVVPISSFLSSTLQYQLEVLNTQGEKVITVTQSPQMSVNLISVSQNQAGTYTVQIKYTSWNKIVSLMDYCVEMVQTDCKSGVSGLDSLASSYSQRVLGGPLQISIASILNAQCNFNLQITVLSSTNSAVTLDTYTLTQATFSAQDPITFQYPKTADSTLEFRELGLNDKQFIGSYTMQIAVLNYVTSAEEDSKKFSYEVLDCNPFWVANFDIQTATYWLGDQNSTYAIPSFVTQGCHDLVTTYEFDSSYPDFYKFASLQQTSSLGESDAIFQILTTELTYMGTYSLTVTCTDSVTSTLRKQYLDLTINSRCMKSIISTAPVYQRTIEQNGQLSRDFQYDWSEFTQQIEGCEFFGYYVNFEFKQGEDITSWFSANLTHRFVNVSQLSSLNSPSRVKVTITGLIKDSKSLPSASTSFDVFVYPESKYTITEVKTEQINTTESNATTFNASSLYEPKTKQRVGPPILPKIKTISTTGMINITFNKPVKVPQVYQNITARSLQEQNQTHNLSGILSVKVINGADYEDKNRTKIQEIRLIDFQRGFFAFQVVFLEPQRLTETLLTRDHLQIKFLDSNIFVADDFGLIDGDFTLKVMIPQQITQEEQILLVKIEKSVASIASSFAITNLILNIVVSVGLRYVWNLVNLLQYLVYMESWIFLHPGNVTAFLKYIKYVALMEFIPTKEITDKISGWVGLEPEEPGNLVQNLGLMLILGICVAVVMTALIVGQYLVRCNYKFYRRYRMLKDKIFYNFFLRYLLQSCLKLAVGAGVSLTLIDWSNVGTNQIGTIMASSLILLVILISPIIFGVILMKSFKDLSRPSILNKIGSLYLGIRETDKWSLAYSQVFMVRRILFVALTFGFKNQPSLQIHFFIFCSLGYFIFLGVVQPHDLRFTTRLEMANETLFLLICYCFILLTDLTYDPLLRKNIGWVLVSFVILILLLNFALIFGMGTKEIYRKYQLHMQRREVRLARRGIYINPTKLFLNRQLTINQQLRNQQQRLKDQANQSNNKPVMDNQLFFQDYSPRNEPQVTLQWPKKPEPYKPTKEEIELIICRENALREFYKYDTSLQDHILLGDNAKQQPSLTAAPVIIDTLPQPQQYQSSNMFRIEEESKIQKPANPKNHVQQFFEFSQQLPANLTYEERNRALRLKNSELMFEDAMDQYPSWINK